MPEINSYADVFRDWDALLGACERNTDLLVGADPFVQELETFRDLARELKVEQEHLSGHRKAATQSLVQAVDGGREAARKLRSFVLTHLGSRSELLTQFGITPNRSRKVRRTQKPAPTTPPSPPPVEAGAPAAGEPSTVTTRKEEPK